MPTYKAKVKSHGLIQSPVKKTDGIQFIIVTNFCKETNSPAVREFNFCLWLSQKTLGKTAEVLKNVFMIKKIDLEEFNDNPTMLKDYEVELVTDYVDFNNRKIETAKYVNSLNHELKAKGMATVDKETSKSISNLYNDILNETLDNIIIPEVETNPATKGNILEDELPF